MPNLRCHNDILTWKSFQHYCCFVREICQWLVDSPHIGPEMWNFDVAFVVSMNKFLNKQSSFWWYEMSWHLHDITVMYMNISFIAVMSHEGYGVRNPSWWFVQWQERTKETLTHWGRVTHICVSKLTIIGSDNGLSPERCQGNIWTFAGILLIGTLGANFSKILSKIHTFSVKKMHLKTSSAKRRPLCLGLNMLKVCITGPLWWDFTGHKWIPLTKGQ